MTEQYDDDWNPDEMLESYMQGSTDLPVQPTSELDALIDSFKFLTGSPEQRIRKMTALIGQLANPSQKRNLGKPVNWEQWLEDNDDDSYDWAIPGLLERTDRLVCVAAEGVGKTMLARQVAICVAAGIHPFTGQKIEPVDTLTVDLENPRKIIQRTSRKIMHRAQERSRSGLPIKAELIIEPSGINLLRQSDQDWLEEQIAETRPGIVFIGPLYKSFIDPGGRSSEAVATEVAMYYDYLRNQYQCALWMEMHAPLGNAVSGRDLRPFGSAVWSRWPEFGLAIERDAINPEGYKFKYFRGARDKRDFPLEAHRGGPMDFPFVVDSYMTD